MFWFLSINYVFTIDTLYVTLLRQKKTSIALKSDMEISICVVIPFIFNDVSFQNFGQNISMAIN